MLWVLRALSLVAGMASLVSFLVAGLLFWEFTFGACRDGCEGGAVFILFYPSLLLAIVTAGIAVAAHIFARRQKQS